MILTEFAPAKVNLFLHVGPAQADGRHPICSLVTFAGLGDDLTAEPAGRYSLVVEGVFADQAGPDADNLVTRALELAGAPPMAVRLTKRLPAAAGLGGGSSDAGAALRLAGRMFPGVTPDRLDRAAEALGADGPMCLRATPCIAEGEGERLTVAPALPDSPAVLVNPGLPSPTGAVYQAYDELGGAGSAERPLMPSSFSTVRDLAAFLALQRNDLEAPAIRLEPGIGAALAEVRAMRDVLLARMSGSGATVFGLFATDAAAKTAADDLRRARPGWWIQPCRLNLQSAVKGARRAESGAWAT